MSVISGAIRRDYNTVFVICPIQRGQILELYVLFVLVAGNNGGCKLPNVSFSYMSR